MVGSPDSEILLEMNRMRGAREVRAGSAGDGLEVVFVAPANGAQSEIGRLGRARLAYVRGKSRGTGDTGKRPDKKGGWIA